MTGWIGGCEISFPPELDEYFQVRYIKRGAEPIGSLKDRLKEQLTGSVTSLRRIIKSDRDQKKAEENQSKSAFENAEQLMSDLNAVLPKNQNGKSMSKEEEQQKIDEILSQSISQDGNEELKQEERRREIMSKVYSIVPVKYPQQFLFETENLLDDKIVIKLNVNHPFYQKVINPLCGDITEEEGAEEYNDKAKIKDAIMLLLLSYAKLQLSSLKKIRIYLIILWWNGVPFLTQLSKTRLRGIVLIRNGLSGKNDVLKSLCETYVVTIRNMHLPKKPRVFDVTVNSKGEILRYDMQNIKGNLYIEDVEVHKQIMAALAEK
mgnify:CR=1 FL=1